MIQDRICRHCGEEYDSSEIMRRYGEYSPVYHNNFCSAQCYTKFMTENKTDLLDALGNPIYIGKKYGYSVDNNGLTNVVTGECTKVNDAEQVNNRRVTLKVITAGSGLYSDSISTDKWRTKKSVNVKPNKLFPI